MSDQQMTMQAMTAYGGALEEMRQDLPTPSGDEVLVEVTHCGACHSDVHVHDGYFDMGDDKKLDLSRARALPFALGHEIEGIVRAVGPDAKSAKIGTRCVVFPWIGCGDCADCGRGNEHLCGARALGVTRNGGFASHCLVPHEKYILDCAGIAPGLAGTYMCSGITAYTALKYLAVAQDAPLLIVGLGGVGMMGLEFARALFDRAPYVADIDAKKRALALEMGAAAAYDPSDREAIKALLADTQGGASRVADFVGAEASLNFATACLRRGGKVAIVGLFGGKLAMPIPMLPLRSISLCGTFTGTLEDTKAMLEIVKSGKIKPIPIEERPLKRAGETLDDLRHGRVVGRVVLTP